MKYLLFEISIFLNFYFFYCGLHNSIICGCKGYYSPDRNTNLFAKKIKNKKGRLSDSELKKTFLKVGKFCKIIAMLHAIVKRKTGLNYMQGCFVDCNADLTSCNYKSRIINTSN